MTHEFKPDWCIAPGETLREWMEEEGLSPAALSAVAAESRETKFIAARLIREVLDRQPLTAEHAETLARGTSVPARFWLALEHDYRAGLAAGLTDASDM